MSVDAEHSVGLQIGHILFLDIVGYSKLLTNEQRERVGDLTQIVRETEPFRTAESAGKLMMLPTGDGMVLAFFTTPDAPVRCAIDISRALGKDHSVPVRMGIHSGPVEHVTDVTERPNLTGAGVNMAQRVMDCGDAGHILLSGRAADDLMQMSEWKSKLHPLGELEAKHGVRIPVVNLHDGEVGNAQVPQKIRAATLRENKARKRKWLLVSAAVVVIAAGAVIAVWLTRQAPIPPDDKSIAVLPFENLSSDKENAFLAGGLQDEILTRLAKIAALKVISRTSTKHYESRPGNLTAIAKQLGVATILEGSVQKVGAKIRVNVQLIKAATDTHLWAESYDRELIDALTVESEVATEIAGALRVALTPEEKARIDDKPTNNPEAYALYLRARQILSGFSRGDLERTAGLYEQAIAIDPKFVLARAGLSNALVTMYVNFEPREAFKVRGWAEAQEAVRLNPDSGEAHMAVALYLDRIDLNYEAAAKEYEIALRFLPNDSDLFRRIGLMQRRQGHWKEGLTNVERAVSLDPRNGLSVGWLAGTYEDLGKWPAAEECRQRGLTIALTGGSPQEVAEAKFLLGQTHFYGTGDPSLLQKALSEVPADFDSGGGLTQFRYDANMLLRDYDAAEKVLERSLLTVFENPFTAPVTKAFLQGKVAATRGDSARAKVLFEAELPHAENEVKEHPETAKAHLQLGLVYAWLGGRENALREGQRAMELLPESQDAYYGLDITFGFAMICARLGDGDLAIPLIERLLRTPRGVGFQDLRFSPDWDPLRKDPRFQKIITGPEPKVNYN